MHKGEFHFYLDSVETVKEAICKFMLFQLVLKGEREKASHTKGTTASEKTVRHQKRSMWLKQIQGEGDS